MLTAAVAVGSRHWLHLARARGGYSSPHYLHRLIAAPLLSQFTSALSLGLCNLSRIQVRDFRPALDVKMVLAGKEDPFGGVTVDVAEAWSADDPAGFKAELEVSLCMCACVGVGVGVCVYACMHGRARKTVLIESTHAHYLIPRSLTQVHTVHTYAFIHILPPTRTHTHTNTPAHPPTHTHPPIHTHTHTNIHAHPPTHPHTTAHTHTRARARTHTHSPTHTTTYTHTQSSLAQWKSAGKRGIWLKFPTSHGGLVGGATANGFNFHHAHVWSPMASAEDELQLCTNCPSFYLFACSI